jgi:acetyl esterase/lipase
MFFISYANVEIGHLSVSLLLHLKTPFPGVTSNIRQKPNGALLITPWLDIFPTRLYRSQDAPPRDILDDPAGKYWASCFADPASLTDPAVMTHLRPLQCSLPWNEILPSKCAITTGTDDILRDDCLELRDQAKENGLDIEVLIEENQVHDWQWGEATNDLFYLSTSRSKKAEFDFKGAKQLARIITEMSD